MLSGRHLYCSHTRTEKCNRLNSDASDTFIHVMLFFAAVAVVDDEDYEG